MNTDELKVLLRQHADEVSEDTAIGRVGDVRGRIRTAQRRRTAGAGLAAALVLGIGVGAMGLWGGESEPAPVETPDRLAGVEVPETIEVEGFTYRYASGAESSPGEERLRLTLEDGGPLVVSFASSAPGSYLSLESTTSSVSTGGASGRFDGYTVIPDGSDVTLTLRQDDGLGDGRLALAVYELAEVVPAGGVSDGTSAFRGSDGVVEQTSAVFGGPGESDLSVAVPLTAQPTRFALQCRNVPDDHLVRLRLPGFGVVEEDCVGDEAAYDAGIGDGLYDLEADDVGTANGSVRLIGPDGSPAVDGDVVLGLATYVESADRATVAGMELATRQIADGHVIGLVASREGVAGQRSLTYELSASETLRAIQVVVPGAPREIVRATVTVNGELVETTGNGTDGPLAVGGIPLRPGVAHTVTVRITGNAPADGVVGLALFEEIG